MKYTLPSFQSPASSDAYRRGWELAFGKKQLDEWTREEPWTWKELAEMRLDMIDGALCDDDDYITCDNCTRRRVCKLAYDFYNTNGDCLYDK